MITLQSGIELLVATLGFVYAVGQIKNTSEQNKISINTLKNDLTTLIENNNKAIQDLFNTFKTHQKENLEREIAHLKDIVEINSREQRADIQELRKAQQESNRIKERIALAEASIRSLHKRLDIDPPMELPE